MILERIRSRAGALDCLKCQDQLTSEPLEWPWRNKEYLLNLNCYVYLIRAN